MPKKICTKCHAEKPVEEYYRRTGRRSGRTSECKVCLKERGRLYHLQNLDQTRQSSRRWHAANRQRVSEYARRRYAANRERMCEDVRRYRAANPEKCRESRNRWQAANPEKRKALLRRSNANKMSTVGGRLRSQMSVAIWLSLKYRKQGRKWESLVGYNLNQLKRHLEKQFLPGMSWKNRNEWHIDHRTPISAFNYEKSTDLDFKRCWELKNLRPLWKRENLVKHAKIDKPFQPALLI